MSTTSCRSLSPKIVSKSPVLQSNKHSMSNSKKQLGSKTKSNQKQKKSIVGKKSENIKFLGQMCQNMKQILNNKRKLMQSLQIYIMFENSQQNQRCLQHNNTMSLYCINQKRILCVNCLYGMHRHRNHKVLPLKDSMKYVQADNKELKKVMEKTVVDLDDKEKIAQMNIRKIDEEMRRVGRLIQQVYSRKAEELKRSYEQSKRDLERVYIPMVQKCKEMKEQLQIIRSTVIRIVSRFDGKRQDDNNEIIKNLVFMSIFDLCGMKNRLIDSKELNNLLKRFTFVL